MESRPELALASEHGALVGSLYKASKDFGFEDREHILSLAYICQEYQFALKHAHASSLVRDRGLEDTLVVLREDKRRDTWARALISALSDERLLHSNLIVLLTLEEHERARRIHARNETTSRMRARESYEDRIGENYNALIAASGPAVRVVRVDRLTPVQVADLCLGLIDNALPDASRLDYS